MAGGKSDPIGRKDRRKDGYNGEKRYQISGICEYSGRGAEAGDGMYGADRHRLLRGSRERSARRTPGEGEGRSQRQHDQERKTVIVPNTDHLKGIPAAAAAGIVAGDPKKELEVIASVTKEQITAMKEFLQTTPVEVEHIDNGITFDIIVTLTRGTDTSMVRIANYHTNVVHIEKNGEVIRDIPVNGEEEEGLTDRSLLDMEHIWDFIHTVDVNDIREVLERQKTYNMAIAREGMRGKYGSNIGALLLDMNGNDVRTRREPWRQPDPTHE